jgi:hypothetical protein
LIRGREPVSEKIMLQRKNLDARVMHDERANKSVPRPPRCAVCARPMQLVRRTPRFGGLPDLYTFECEDCGEQHIEEGEAADRLARLQAVRADWGSGGGHPH